MDHFCCYKCHDLFEAGDFTTVCNHHWKWCKSIPWVDPNTYFQEGMTIASSQVAKEVNPKKDEKDPDPPGPDPDGSSKSISGSPASSAAKQNCPPPPPPSQTGSASGKSHAMKAPQLKGEAASIPSKTDTKRKCPYKAQAYSDKSQRGMPTFHQSVIPVQ